MAVTYSKTYFDLLFVFIECPPGVSKLFFGGGGGNGKGSGVSSKLEISWRERQSETPTPLPDRRLPLGRLFTVPYFIVRSSGSSGDYSRTDSVLGLRRSLDAHFPIMGHFSSEKQFTQVSLLVCPSLCCHATARKTVSGSTH